eukprot:623305_1
MNQKMVSSTLKGIEADLRSLSLDTRKRHPNVKEAAERALQSLRPVRKSSGSQCLHALQSEGVLRPFLSACATKEPELTIRSLKTIQKLFTLDCVTSTTFATIIGTLRVQAESQDEQVLLKIYKPYYLPRLRDLSRSTKRLFARRL